MGIRKLEKYPILVDPFLDFESTRRYFRTAICNYSIKEERLDSGEIIVYLNQQRESNQQVSTPSGHGRICEHGVVICGYKLKPGGILKLVKSPKIRMVPEHQREQLKSELLQKFGDKKPAFVDFWSNFG